MKTLYYCEICNKSFEVEADCAEHEKLCRIKYPRSSAYYKKLLKDKSYEELFDMRINPLLTTSLTVDEVILQIEVLEWLAYKQWLNGDSGEGNMEARKAYEHCLHLIRRVDDYPKKI